MKAFINAQIFTGQSFLKDNVVLTENGKMVAITKDLPESAELIDCEGSYLVPGLVDLQIYGGGGYLFSSELTDESLNVIADALVKKGTTGFVITLATNSFEVFRRAIAAVKRNTHPAVIGLQLEGPYINPLKKGAHLERYIKKPDLDELKELLEFAEGTVKMMTLAPEQCNKETIELLQHYGVVVSAGHSNATFEQAMIGFNEWKIPTATHLYNAMSPMHHRKPGLPTAVFQSQSCASVIPDGIHVDFEMIKIAKKLMGDRLFFITDAVEELRSGEYIHIRQKDHFTLPDGTLSGSALTMPLAVKNGVEKIGLSLEESLRMATIYPAKLEGLSDRGRIQKGVRADFTCLSKSLELKFTVLEEKMFFPN